jgi:hypothetical protein
MNARVGKIARLPAAVRDELNRRLHNGALGKNIVPWLNALPEVQRVLTELFGGHPIAENNLSNWRRGGLQDWLVEQERRARLEELASNDQDQNASRVGARMEKRLVLELAEQLERLAVIKDPTERFKRLIRLSREFCRVQKSHTRGLEIGLLQAKAHESVRTRSTPIRNGSNLIQPFTTKKAWGEGANPSSTGLPPVSI